jgi:tetratricopeptide (TPR) repeat protein
MKELLLLSSPFGELLHTYRKRQQLTQTQLAKRLGVHTNTVSSWELGTYLPAARELVLEIAQYLLLNEQETRNLLEASLTALSPHWLVPFPRNPFFTGRAEILAALHSQLSGQQTVALTQLSALSGLGGVGKTQLALEYAYRYGLEYHAVFWIAAETEKLIVTSVLRIAEVLQLPGHNDKNQQRVVAAVQRWLSTHQKWLLIWDNVEDLDLLNRFLPASRYGAVLLTTRCQALGTLAQGMDLLPMEQQEGMQLLFRRARLLEVAATEEQMQQFAQQMPQQYEAAAELVEEMAGLPLALDQAGAYLEKTRCGLLAYRDLFHTRRAALLQQRGEGSLHHPASVFTTFILAVTVATHRHPAVGDLLRVCALLQPAVIPEELFLQGGEHLGPVLQAVCSDPLEWNRVVAVAGSYSLLQRQPEEQTFSLHRLVQAVLLESLLEDERRQLVLRTIEAVAATFPAEVVYANWRQCERLLPHALLCASWLGEEQNPTRAALHLLGRTGTYLRERGRYTKAQPLLEHALAIAEQQVGPRHPDTTTSLNNLATLYYRQGQYELAKPLIKRALAIVEQQLGNNHPFTAISLNNLANIHCRQGRYKLAKPLYQRALAISEQQLGPDHPDTAHTLQRLAVLHRDWGQEEAESERLFVRTLTIRERLLVADHPDLAETLHEFAVLRQKQGQWNEALSFYRRALEARSQSLGSGHPDTLDTRNRLVVLLQEHQNMQQQPEKPGNARSLAERTLQFRSQSAGEAHPLIAATRTLYTQLLQKQAETQNAEASEAGSAAVPASRREDRLEANAPRALQKRVVPSALQTDPLQGFLAACCELQPRAWCRSADLWQAYVHWAEQYERFHLSRRALTTQLQARGFQADRTKTARIWRGIALVASATDDTK